MGSTTSGNDVVPTLEDEIEGIDFVDYQDENQLESVMSLVGRDLSEPYSSKTLFVLYQKGIPLMNLLNTLLLSPQSLRIVTSCIDFRNCASWPFLRRIRRNRLRVSWERWIWKKQ